MKQQRTSKRVMALLMGLCLLAVPALAENGAVTPATLVNAAGALAFDTDNVTLTLHADFTWDGQLFKQADYERLQNGSNGRTTMILTTPELWEDQDYVGGYIAYQQGKLSYTLDRNHSDDSYGLAYDAYDAKPRTGLFRTSPLRRAAVALAACVSEALSDAMTVTDTDAGKTYAFVVKEGEVPALLNSTLSYVALSELSRKGHLNQESISCEYEFEDADTTMKAWMTKNTSLTEEQVEAYMNGNENVAYDIDECIKASEEFYAIYADLAQTYDNGVLYVYTDGTTRWYESRDAYLLGENKIELRFDGDYDAIAAQVLTEDFGDDYGARYNALSAYYRDEARKTEPNVVGVRVLENGTIVPYTTYSAYIMNLYTVYEQICNSAASFEVVEATADVQTDSEGRLTAAAGKVSMKVMDSFGAEHSLVIEGTAAMTDYGTTSFTLYNIADNDTFHDIEAKGEIALLNALAEKD